MGDESIANKAFVEALHGRPIPEIERVRSIAKKEDPQNQRVAALAALIHAGERQPGDLDDYIATSSREEGSPLYDFWTHCSLSTIESDAARAKYAQWLALAVLCRCPQVEYLEFHGLGSPNRRERNYSRTQYRGPIDGRCGNRAIWDSNQASWYHELNLSAPLAERALGNPISWHGYDHPVLGWAMEAAVKHGHPVQLRDDPEFLVSMANTVPMRSGRQPYFEIVRFADGGLFTLLSANTHRTRGPVMATQYVPAQRLLKVYSPAEQTGGGEWTDCMAGMASHTQLLEWTAWQRNNPAISIGSNIPNENIEYHVIWDQDGCRFLGDTPPVEKLPDPVPETAQGLASFDAAGRKIAAQGEEVQGPERDTRLRTAAEVMRRITEDTIESAAAGAETLARDLEGML